MDTYPNLEVCVLRNHRSDRQDCVLVGANRGIYFRCGPCFGQDTDGSGWSV